MKDSVSCEIVILKQLRTWCALSVLLSVSMMLLTIFHFVNEEDFSLLINVVLYSRLCVYWQSMYSEQSCLSEWFKN